MTEPLREKARKSLKEGYYKQTQNLFGQAADLCPSILPQILLDYEARIADEPQKIGPRLSLVGFLFSRGENETAIIELEEALDLELPNNIEAYNLLGRIYIKQERVDDVITLLEKSIRQGIKDVNLTEILAGAYVEKGRTAEAIKFYEEILAQKPNDKQTLRVLGELYTRLEEFNRAACCYQAMFSEDPEVAREVIQRLEALLSKVEGSVEIREIMADIYVKAINPEAAVDKLKEILRLESTKLEETILKLKNILKSYPNHPQATLALAEALRRQGNFSEAVESYYQLVKVKPEFIGEAIRGYQEVIDYCPEQVLAHSYLGEALLYQNKVPEALQEFGKMVEADPSVAEMVIKKCREVLKAHPQLLDTHVVLGRAYMAKGDFQRAALEAEGAVALDKNLISAYLLLGDAYSKMKLGSKASETLHTALLLDPYNLQVRERYREVKEKEIEGEIEALKERLKEDQWKVSLHLDLAKLYLQVGQREAAIRELQSAQKDTSRAPLAFNLLGNIYRSEGRYDLAAAHYNRALEGASPELSRAVRLNIGTAYEAQGEIRRAIKLYEGILQEDIDFGGLKVRVKQLKATNLLSMRSKPLQMAISDYGKRELVALWGRVRQEKKEDVSISFGQEHNQAGFDYFTKGMYQAAEEEFSLAVQLDPRFAVALNNLGVALARAGRFEAAKTALEKSAALNDESSAVCLNLGDLNYLRGEVKRAVELYRKVGAFDPLSDLADRRLMYMSGK